MNVRSSVLISVFLSLFLTGCNTLGQWNWDRKVKALQNGADYCGKQYLNKFIGTQFDDISVRDYLPSKYEFRVADPRDGKDKIFITDLRFRRMSIYLEKDGIIRELKCG